MKKFFLISLIASGLLLGSCDENKAACFEKKNLSACNELCDIKNNNKACAMQTELGIQKCMDERDIKVCSSLCLMAKDGKELFCKKQKELCSLPENKDKDECQLL